MFEHTNSWVEGGRIKPFSSFQITPNHYRYGHTKLGMTPLSQSSIFYAKVNNLVGGLIMFTGFRDLTTKQFRLKGVTSPNIFVFDIG